LLICLFPQGLGTSTREEAREYFAALQQHRKRFVWGGEGYKEAGSIRLGWLLKHNQTLMKGKYMSPSGWDASWSVIKP